MEAGLVTDSELDEALAEQSETLQRLGQILVSRGLVSEPELMHVLLDQLGRELEKEDAPGSSADPSKRRIRNAVQASISEPYAASNGEVSARVEINDADPGATARATFEAALVAERTPRARTRHGLLIRPQARRDADAPVGRNTHYGRSTLG